MTLSAAEIQRLAKLARLEVPSEQVSEVQSDLNRILALFEQLKQVDTSGVQPLVHAIEVTDVFAPDHVSKSLDVEDVLRNAPVHDESFFKVPPVLG
ncbi:MAG: Asp-tRNA(Asn)/Glu-tRNA(Gln) amidotransferase subunit GatC [Planctomycetaceae bacterium]|jgi:aspartyl-tRNA(Asn)/glutamyl-tRNA(Gln) amidotransferase subunit C|nr:Asp-tRNA(Asn)/Glu-tRNA(Gln) amidotransferase subunit GatC [Planctomycetaceae bacterium]